MDIMIAPGEHSTLGRTFVILAMLELIICLGIYTFFF